MSERCSFCAKPQDDALLLIAGPSVFICDECVEVCGEILRRYRQPGEVEYRSWLLPPSPQPDRISDVDTLL